MCAPFLLVLLNFKESHCKQDLLVYWPARFDSECSVACFINCCQGLKVLNKSQVNTRLFMHGRGLAGQGVSGETLFLVSVHATSSVTYRQLFVDYRHHLARRPLFCGGSWGPLTLAVSGGPLRGGVLLLVRGLLTESSPWLQNKTKQTWKNLIGCTY